MDAVLLYALNRVGRQHVVTATSQLVAKDGARALLRAGSTPFEVIALTYDATYAHWVSERIRIVGRVGSSSANTGNVWMNIGSGAVIPHKALTDAGLSLQLRISGVVHNPGAGTLDLGIQLTPYAAAGAAGTASTDAALVTTTSTSDVMLDSGWVAAPAVTPNTLVKVYARLRDTVTNNNVSDSVSVFGRWIA